MSEENVNRLVDSMKRNYHRHQVDYAIFLGIFLVSLTIKFLSYFIITRYVGDSYYITQDTPLANFFKIILFRSPDGFIASEGYDDIWYHYIPYVEAFSTGWNPYSVSGLPGDGITGYYNYGPLYITFISLATIIFGIDPLFSILISNIFFDSLNCGLAYVIFRHFYNRKGAMLISSLYAISPVMIYYVDVKLLNLPQMTFFTLIFIIAYLRDQDDLMVMSLAFGFVTKFVPAFFMIPMVIYWWKKQSIRDVGRYIGLFTLYSLVICIPYLIDDPTGFIDQFLRSGARLGIDLGLSQIIFLIVRTNLPFFFGVGLTTILMIRYSDILIDDRVYFLRILVFYILGVHGTFYGFYSRSFKYYHGYVMIFYLILFFVTHKGRWSINQKLFTGVILTYLSNVLIFNLSRDIGQFNHRRVFMIYLPGLILLWFIYDIRRLRKQSEKSTPMKAET